MHGIQNPSEVRVDTQPRREREQLCLREALLSPAATRSSGWPASRYQWICGSTCPTANFKCFGLDRTRIILGQDLTAFIGTNGSGKTAACEALLRLFGITGRERAVRADDFQVPLDESEPPTSPDLTIEALLTFPELDEEDQQSGEEEPDANNTADSPADLDSEPDVSEPALGQDVDGEEEDDEESGQDQADRISELAAISKRAVPEFFSRMAADDNGDLKVRIVLNASWEDDGTMDGRITETRIVVARWPMNTVRTTTCRFLQMYFHAAPQEFEPTACFAQPPITRSTLLFDRSM
jgi:hypothetical protein